MSTSSTVFPVISDGNFGAGATAVLTLVVVLVATTHGLAIKKYIYKYSMKLYVERSNLFFSNFCRIDMRACW